MSETPQEYNEPTPADPAEELPRPAPTVHDDGALTDGPEPSDDAKRLAEEHAGEFGDIEGETGDVH